MEISVASQSLVFLFSVLIGCAIGVVYDIFRILRIVIPHGTVLTFIEDFIFWVIAMCVAFWFLLMYNNGQVRWYLLLGFISGFTIYINTLGVLVIMQAKFIVRILKAILHFILIPFLFLAKQICKLFSFLGKKIKKPFIFMKKRCIIILTNLKRKFKRKGGKKRDGKKKKGRHTV